MLEYESIIGVTDFKEVNSFRFKEGGSHHKHLGISVDKGQVERREKRDWLVSILVQVPVFVFPSSLHSDQWPIQMGDWTIT